MRISTSQIYSSGVLGLQSNQQSLFKLQNQLSSGRRILTPADDPVASAQALVVTQSKDINTQYIENQCSARAQLGTLETTLGSVVDLVQATRERAVEAKGILTDNQRGFIATDMKVKLEALLSLANSSDGSGQFLFSGYQGATRPFAIDGSVAPVPPATQAPVTYFGDEGQRLVQVDASRQMASNVSGSEVFMAIRAGNGTFSTSVAGNSGGGINQGTALVDSGSVANPTLWNAAVNAHGGFRIEFSMGGSGLEYQIYETNAPNAPMLAAPAAYTPGQAIPLQKTTAPAADFGARVVISGTPAVGDRFSVAPSSDQSIFKTIQNLIGAIETPVTATFTSTELKNRINAELTNLDRVIDNLGRVMADVGTRQKELETLTIGAKDMDLQYATTLSDLQDLDFTKAISDFTQQQTQLEAAQKTFAQVSRLSLFDIL